MGDAAWWTGLALAAVLSAAGGFAVGRVGRRRVSPVPQPPLALSPLWKTLSAAGLSLDLLPAGEGAAAGGTLAQGEPLARCQPRAVELAGLSCELLDSASAEAMRPGRRVLCLFAPQLVDGRKVNAFETVIAGIDAAQEPPRLLLAFPQDLQAVARRRHARKRVSDQRFVRVRLWQAEPDVSPLHFPDAPPDIWVNAYDGSHGGENAVTDISNGGLALEVRAALVPRGLEPGSPVVLKCSLFQFREKQFRPHWYAGLVRGLGQPEAPDGAEARLRRIAIGFTHVGVLDPARPQGIAWTARTLSEIQGEKP